MQIKHNLLNKNTTANRVSSRGNPVNLSLQPSLHLCKAPFGDRTNKNSIVNRGSPICVRKRNPADCHHLFVWFCLWDSEFGFIIWFSRGSFGQPCKTAMMYLADFYNHVEIEYGMFKKIFLIFPCVLECTYSTYL